MAAGAGEQPVAQGVGIAGLVDARRWFRRDVRPGWATAFGQEAGDVIAAAAQLGEQFRWRRFRSRELHLPISTQPQTQADRFGASDHVAHIHSTDSHAGPVGIGMGFMGVSGAEASGAVRCRA